MATRSTLPLVDSLAEDAKSIGRLETTGALRAQAALVRALVDEVGRHHPSERRIAALHAQLGEELAHLAQLAPGGPMREDEVSADRPLEVLIVEDDAPTLRATTMVVRDLGYACRTATNADEALREYERRPSAIVLSDWDMPGMSGLDLCRALKRRNPDAYVILVTAFHDNDQLLEGARRGVDDFLPKPVDIEDLADRLKAGERLVRAVRVLEGLKDHLGVRSTTREA
jgi:CheY-like chemotaxis protein